MRVTSSLAFSPAPLRLSVLNMTPIMLVPEPMSGWLGLG